MRVQDCQQCHLCKSLPYGNKPVPGRGQGKVMFVQEYINEEDAITEHAVSGLPGAYLDKILEKTKLQVYVTSLVKCRPVTTNTTRPPTQKEISFCQNWISQEIQQINPSVIISAGDRTTKHLAKLLDIDLPKLPIGKLVGNYYGDKVKLVPVYSLNALLMKGQKYTDMVVKAIKNVKEFC